MDLSKIQNIFIVGIKGVAMADLAVIFSKMGKRISGADVKDTQITDELLKKHRITPIVGFEKEKLPADTELIIYSAAHGGTENPLVKYAVEKKIVVMHQAELLGKLLELFKTSIAVCGTHGKTTTSALLSYALINLGVSPSYLVGAPSFSGCEGGDYNKQDYFVIEADEYAVNPPDDKTVKFSFLNPGLILATNIDFDHPDVFSSLDEIKKQFSAFLKDRQVFACADDVNLMSVVTRTHTKTPTTYGFDTDADLRIGALTETQDNTAFELFEKNKSLGIFDIKLFGRKNISNAAGVVAVLLNLGFKSEQIKEAIKKFSGVKRRFEEKFHINDTYLFDDYAHHPAEIEVIIEAARTRFPGHKIVILFQPHTFSRTKALLPDFARSLSQADLAIVAPIFSSAREKKEESTITSADIEKSAKEAGFESVHAASSNEEVLSKLGALLTAKQVIFTMGAGDIYSLDSDIIELLKKAVPTG